MNIYLINNIMHHVIFAPRWQLKMNVIHFAWLVLDSYTVAAPNPARGCWCVNHRIATQPRLKQPNTFIVHVWSSRVIVASQRSPTVCPCRAYIILVQGIKYPGMLDLSVFGPSYMIPLLEMPKKLRIIKAPSSFTKKATRFATPGIDTGEQYCNGWHYYDITSSF